MDDNSKRLMDNVEALDGVDSDVFHSFLKTIENMTNRDTFGGEFNLVSHRLDIKKMEEYLKYLDVMVNIVLHGRYSKINSTYKTLEEYVTDCVDDNIMESMLRLLFYSYLLKARKTNPAGQRIIATTGDVPDYVRKGVSRLESSVEKYLEFEKLLDEHGRQPQEQKLYNKLWGRLMTKKEDEENNSGNNQSGNKIVFVE